MASAEEENEDLKGVLPRAYTRLDNRILIELLRLLGPVELEGDAFGQVYEYFLGAFAMKEGQKGGVFYTPTSIVKLIVEIIEPFHGRPAIRQWDRDWHTPNQLHPPRSPWLHQCRDQCEWRRRADARLLPLWLAKN